MTATLEIAEFDTIADAAEDAVLGAAREAGGFLARQPGFLNRRLAQRPEGGWLDIVEWTSLEAAEAAARAFPTSPEAASFMGVIARVSRMSHASVRLSG
jgi:hypothetical protein